MRSLWPLHVTAAVLLLMSGGFFYFGVNVWASIAVAWLGCGLFCWIVILRFYRPTPLIDDTIPPSTQPDPGKPFSIRDVPTMVLMLTLISAFAPFMLIFVLRACSFKTR